MSHTANSETQAVFFDAVGTLLFPEPSAPVIYAAVAREQGLSFSPEEVRTRFIEAFQREEAFDRAGAWATSEEREYERWQRIVRDTLPGVADAEACFHQLYTHFATPGAWRVNTEAGEVFAALASRGLCVGLASNYDRRLTPVVEGLPALAPLRDAVVVSSAVGHRKPSARFFEEVVRVAGCARSRILFVGDDREYDHDGAAAAGLKALLLDERARHPDLPTRIGTLRELLSHL